jgi:hypothetical protein
MDNRYNFGRERRLDYGLIGSLPAKEHRLSDASRLQNEWRIQILTSRQPLVRRRYYVQRSDTRMHIGMQTYAGPPVVTMR